MLILPRSADYSEEVWMEIREKAISLLQTYFFDGAVPSNAVSDEEELESEITYESELLDKQGKERAPQGPAGGLLTMNNFMVPTSSHGKGPLQSDSPSQHHESGLSPTNFTRSEGKHSRSNKKAKKRHARQKSQRKSDDILEKESASLREDDTAMSDTEEVESSGSHCASPEDSKSRKTPIELAQESSLDLLQKSGESSGRKSADLLKDGCVIALHSREHSLLHVSRQRAKGGGWILDIISGVSKRDPAAQFLVNFGSKVSVNSNSCIQVYPQIGSL